MGSAARRFVVENADTTSCIGRIEEFFLRHARHWSP
jgi:hypothetical protein